MNNQDFLHYLNHTLGPKEIDNFWEMYFSPITDGWVPFLRERVDWMVDRVQGPRVLDIGCGSGILSYLTACRPDVQEVLAVDACDHAIKKVSANLRTANPIFRDKIRVVKSMIENLSSVGIFDTILAGEVLEHVLDDKQVIECIIRHLHPNSTLLLSVPSTGVDIKHGHLRSFTSDSVQSLLRERFEILAETKVRYWLLSQSSLLPIQT